MVQTQADVLCPQPHAMSLVHAMYLNFTFTKEHPQQREVLDTAGDRRDNTGDHRHSERKAIH